MQKRKSRAYYQYMLDVCDQRVGYYSTDDVANIVYDLLDDGAEQEALAACQKGLDQHPDDEFVLIVKAKVLTRMKRYDEAERLLKGNPDEQSPFGISIRFGIDLSRMSNDEALRRLMDDRQHDRLTSQETVDIVDEYFDSLQHSILSPCLQRLARLMADSDDSDDGQKAETLGRIGALLMDCNCYREAVTVLEQALDVDAYDVYSWQDLTRCQYELEMLDECEQSCEMGLAIDPQHPLFNFVLGNIHCKHERYHEAIACFEITRAYIEGRLSHEDLNLERLEMEQQRFYTYEMLATAYHYTGQPERAIECYEALVQRVPSFSEGYRHLALLYTEMGDYEQALQQADMVLQLEPDNKDILLAKAELSLSMQRFAEADSAYRRLLKLRPKDEASRRLMREYFESIGDEEALKEL